MSPRPPDQPPTRSPWLTHRTAGVLAHLSSLPGPYGIGNMGQPARRFIDFLAKSGFRNWQLCPVGTTSYGDSPYQSFSSFAGNPYFLDLDELVELSLLQREDLAPLEGLATERVDYARLYQFFWDILARAHEAFIRSHTDTLPGFGSFQEFRREKAHWLVPFADFMALKARFGERPWTHWPLEARGWHEDTRSLLPGPTRLIAERHEFYQYLFFGQWKRLRHYANERGVSVIGDIPIFVALDSADTWHSRPVFRLNADGTPEAVAGVPPDYFSELGQLWGNPLYDWDYLRKTGYAWWIERLRATFELFDIVRLDHFRGFDSFWEIPADARDARNGQWRNGPGLEFFEAVHHALPKARIIAEDLGYITRSVFELRRLAGLPGMKILQFGYGHDDNNVNLPHFFDRNSVVYTGTHDNCTVRGWLQSLNPDEEAAVDAYFGLNGDRSAWPFIRTALASVSNLAVIPMQDLLDLPASARMNTPGVPAGNWQWRFTRDALEHLEAGHARHLCQWIRLFDRTGDTRQRDYSAAPGTESPGQPTRSPLQSPTSSSSPSLTNPAF